MLFFIKLLSGGLFNAFRKHWKLFVIAAAVAVAYFVVQDWVHDYGEKQFKLGVSATISQMKTQVSDRNAANRKTEKVIDQDIRDFAASKDKENVVRQKAEQKHADKIMTVTDSVPMWSSVECAVTPQVIAERNAIRALGPKE